MAEVSVRIPVAATWPSTEELTLRNAVTDELDAANVGKCTGAGDGRGEMDFSYEVVDIAAARTAVKDAMERNMPNFAYRVQVSE